MTDAELLQWARVEHQLRIQDLKDRTPEGLKRAQAGAEKRRKTAGLSRSDAARAVRLAGEERRRAEMLTPGQVQGMDSTMGGL